jgi:hypothetical protein
MKIKKFNDFLKTNENSDLDWSDKNWTDRDTEGVNPPNSGLEGSSAEPMDYSAGDYGEIADEPEVDLAEVEMREKENFEAIKAEIDDLTQRVLNLEKKKK